MAIWVSCKTCCFNLKVPSHNQFIWLERVIYIPASRYRQFSISCSSYSLRVFNTPRFCPFQPPSSVHVQAELGEIRVQICTIAKNKVNLSFLLACKIGGTLQWRSSLVSKTAARTKWFSFPMKKRNINHIKLSPRIHYIKITISLSKCYLLCSLRMQYKIAWQLLSF